MQTQKLSFSKVSGIIVIGCAIAIIVIKYLTQGDLDSYIMPFMLMCMGVVFLSRKNKEEEKPFYMSPKQARIAMAIVLVSLIAGIIVFFLVL